MFEKKIFTQTLLNKAGNGFENSKGAYYRVFNNGYSKHFRDMTSGTKLKKMIKKHVWKKIFTQTLLNKAGNGFENSKGAYYRVFNNGYSKHFRDMTSGTKLKKMIKEHVWKKNFYSNAFE